MTIGVQVGVKGSWRELVGKWVGVGGVWQPVKAHWVAGEDLLWHPGFLDIGPNLGGNTPDLDEANEYVVFAYQSAIRLNGDRFDTGTAYGNNTNWALYLVNENLQEWFGNFNSALRTNTPVWTTIDSMGFIEITAAAGDEVLTSTVGDGALTCTGVFGWSYGLDFVVGILAQVDSLPAAGEVAWLWWGGTVAGGYAGVCIDQNGQVALHLVSASASVSRWPVPLIDFTYVPGSTIGVAVKVHPDAPATNEIWINGVQMTPDQPLVATNWPNYAQDVPFMVGRGPNSGGALVNTVGRFAKFRISRNMTDSGAQYSIVGSVVGVRFKNAAGAVTLARVLRRIGATKLDFLVPNVPNGPYSVSVAHSAGESRSLPFHVVSPVLLESFDQTFVTALDKQEAAERWMCPQYAWGGDNGGSIALNAAMQDGQLVLRAQGDLCTVGNPGVGMFGVPVERITRVGAGVRTKKYAGPGTFEAWVTYPDLAGASPAFYLFFYQEIYPGDERYAALLAAGYLESGSVEDGYYIVCNEEIDMEVPWAGDFDQINLASWLAEQNKYEINTTSLLPFGIVLNNGNEHHLMLKWFTAGDPGGARIEFYVDGIYIRTNTTYIPSRPMRIMLDFWFPSGAYQWAGNANWDKQDFFIRRVKYTKDPTQSMDQAARESYPNTTYRSLSTSNVLPDV